MADMAPEEKEARAEFAKKIRKVALLVESGDVNYSVLVHGTDGEDHSEFLAFDVKGLRFAISGVQVANAGLVDLLVQNSEHC